MTRESVRRAEESLRQLQNRCFSGWTACGRNDSNRFLRGWSPV